MTDTSDIIESTVSVVVEPQTDQPAPEEQDMDATETEPLLGTEETNVDLVRKMSFKEILFACLWPFTVQKAQGVKPWSPDWIKQVFLYAYMVLSCVNVIAQCTMLVLRMIEPPRPPSYPNPYPYPPYYSSAPVDRAPMPVWFVDECLTLLSVFLWYVPGMIVLLNWTPQYWPKIVSIFFLLVHRKAQIALSEIWCSRDSYGYGRNWRYTHYNGVLDYLYWFQCSFNESLLNWFVIIAIFCIAPANIALLNQPIDSVKVFDKPISSLKLFNVPIFSFSVHDFLIVCFMLTVFSTVLIYIVSHLSDILRVIG